MIIVSIYCLLHHWQFVQLLRHREFRNRRVRRSQRWRSDYCPQKYQLLVIYISWPLEAAPMTKAASQFNQSVYLGSCLTIAIVSWCLSSINKTNLLDHCLDSETPYYFRFLLLLSNQQLFVLPGSVSGIIIYLLVIRFFTFLCSFLR